jgi:hypothetical protein
MMHRFAVVLSQGQTLHPDRQTLEQQLVSQLVQDGHGDVWVVPHLYDLDAQGPSLAALREIGGDLIVLAWLYPRATRWILARQGIGGQAGRTGWDDEEPLPDTEPSTPRGESTASTCGDTKRLSPTSRLFGRSSGLTGPRQLREPAPASRSAPSTNRSNGVGTR